MLAIASVSDRAVNPLHQFQLLMLGQGWARWCGQAVLCVGLALMGAGCSQTASVPVRPVQIQQNWEVQPGKTIGGHRVVGGLGDISIAVGGDRVYAPFDGLLQPNDLQDCYIFSSPDVPAYLFRFCGLSQPKLGPAQQGEPIGSAEYLQFAALRRQPDGKWTMVEPASDVLERTLDSQ